ncbi:MAG: 23S rRNA pseudouridine(1911/1915/1917) synthase RluD [Gammaproteobacteria bacterium]|nr:23S rRNA pseudouridine(1911/1915/1917) synthase RluD [Gammaproteobacteria bacterium]
MKLIQQQYRIEHDEAGNRLDQTLSQRLPEYSRSKIQQWIREGFISLNHKTCKPRQKVYADDLVDLDVPIVSQLSDQPQAVEFEILHRDDDIFVIDKPAGVVVHPAAGHPDGTLVNGLLNIDTQLEQLPRAGIVHRLDKDTTGIMVVARNLRAHHWLVDQLQQRLVKREYIAITQGVVTAGRSIETGIARHAVNRKKMAVNQNGKLAITHFQVARKFQHHSLINVQLETGRTHQIRVHMAHIKYPLLGDPVYGGRERIPRGIGDALTERIRNFNRQALHARRLSFEHPASQQFCEFEAAIPDDFQQLLNALDAA